MILNNHKRKVYLYVVQDTVDDEHFQRCKIKNRKGKFFFPLPFALPRRNGAALLVRTTRSHERPQEHVTLLEIIL